MSFLQALLQARSDGENAQHTTRLQVQLGQGAQEVQKGLKGLQPRSFAGHVTPRAFIKA